MDVKSLEFQNHRCLIVPWLVADGILTSILSSCIMAYIFRHDEFDSVPLVCSVLAGKLMKYLKWFISVKVFSL